VKLVFLFPKTFYIYIYINIFLAIESRSTEFRCSFHGISQSKRQRTKKKENRKAEETMNDRMKNGAQGEGKREKLVA